MQDIEENSDTENIFICICIYIYIHIYTGI